MLFYNPAGPGRLYDVAYELGLDFADDGRSFAPVDIDGDGDLDIAMASLQRLRLMENRGPSGGFVRVTLKATKTDAQALGAVVKVRAGGVEQMDYVKATAGFQTQVPLTLHFGVGAAEAVDIEVKWPSGGASRFEAQAVNQAFIIEEGGGIEAVEVKRWPSESRPRSAGSFALRIDAKTVDGHRARLANGGKPAVVNFWAPWCAPCREELPALAKLSASREGVDFVGVSVETAKVESVKQAIAEHRLTYPQYYADDAVMTSFFGGDGEAPLPSTFVFDGDGTMVRAFYRPITAEELDGVLSPLLATSRNAELLVKLGGGLLMRGELAAARKALEDGLAADPDAPFALVAMGTLLTKEGRPKDAIPVLKRALKADPELPAAHFALGIAATDAGDGDAALAAFTRAVALKDDSVKYLMSLGAAQARARDHTAAKVTFERVVELDPQSVKGWLNLATTKLNLRDHSGPKDLEKVLELDPDNAQALGLLRQLGLR